MSVTVSLSAQDLLLYKMAGSTSNPYSSGSIFGSDELLDMTLTTDLKTVIFDIYDSAALHPAIVSYTDPQGILVTIPATVQTRGHFRRSRNVCNFPPLRLHFDKEAARNTLFENSEKLKLTTHCKSNNLNYDQYYLVEYLIYRMYSLLTDYSFRVRLVRMTYIDSEGKLERDTRFGFFIEDDEKLAHRTKCSVFQPVRLPQVQANQPLIDLFTVFQYMIGNTDWSVFAGHNCEYLKPDDGGPVIVVPYDFDFSGAIYAPYATTDPKLPITSVRERLYRGNCKTKEKLQPVFDLFNSHKDELYRLYVDCPYLKENVKKTLLEYYDKFYHIINTPAHVEKEFNYDCTER